ncbi:MAG: acylphosphatase [Rhodospirillales bacterium]|jgi:acylphosphatase
MTQSSRIAKHVLVSGRVQGVWFRGWTIENAQARGLVGWVRNRPDGTVEAVFAGPADLVDDMIAACHTGPASARVAAVAQSDTRDEGWRDFAQRPTGED